MPETQPPGQQALAHVEAAWNAAARGWNVRALSEVYAEDTAFFGGRPGHCIGRAAVADYFASYTGLIESAALTLTEQAVRALADGVWLAQGYGAFEFVLAGSKPSRNVLRTTLVLVHREARWQILQHHFSESPGTPPLGER
ncbi:MAG: SgcJ/EcaC family oxidoreductase [Comamonadaceae bacterium]|nr:MAG: SgcJ/EcaC family oxidoreductase [Comamonadaceae bacterium]